MGGRSFAELVRTPEGGPAFVPLLEEVASRVGDVTHEQMTADPTLWAGSVDRTAALVGADAAAIGWDPSILAEACGVPIRWENDRAVLGEPLARPNPAAQTSARVPAFLEAARRLAGRPERGCIVAVPAPASLAAYALGPQPDRQSLAALKSIVVGIAEGICRSRPDALALIEDAAAASPSPELRRIYTTLRNVADYYGVATLFYAESYGDLPSAAAVAASLRIDHWMVGADDAGLAPDPAAVVSAAAGFASVAVPLPLGDAESARRTAEAALAGARSGPIVYFTTAGLVPRHSDIGLLREVGAMVRESLTEGASWT